MARGPRGLRRRDENGRHVGAVDPARSVRVVCLCPHPHPRVGFRSRVESRNRAGAACVQPAMTDYTDEELSLMHLDGIDCPDDDHARELYDALDQVDFLLWMIRGI